MNRKTVVFIFIIGLLGYTLYLSRQEHSELKKRLGELYLENGKMKKAFTDQTVELDVNQQRLISLQEIYAQEKEDRLREKEEFEATYEYLLYAIDSILHEKHKIEALLNEEMPIHSQGYIEELLVRRDKLEALIQEESKKSQNLATKLADMKIQMRKNDQYVSQITVALLEAYDFLASITSNDMTIENTIQQNTVINLEKIHEGDNPFLEIGINSESSDILGELKEMMESHHRNLIRWEYYIENVEILYNSNDSTLKINKALNERLANLKNNLEIKEKKLEEYFEKINRRYLIVENTDKLVHLGVIKSKRWRRDTKNRGVDLSKINPQSFINISFDEPYIVLPKSQGIIRNLITPHPSYSYEIQADENRIRIFDPQEFWKASFFVLVETDQ